MKNTTILALILLIIAASAFFVFNNKDSNNNEGDVKIITGDVQKITLSSKNLNYYPNTIKVKEGIPELTEEVIGKFNKHEL